MNQVIGKIGIWPKGEKFMNQLLQIYLVISDLEIVFNGYVNLKEKSLLEHMLASYMNNITVSKKGEWDSRKTAVQKLLDWSLHKGLRYDTDISKFTELLKILLKPKVESPIVSEVHYTEDLLSKDLLMDIVTETAETVRLNMYI